MIGRPHWPWTELQRWHHIGGGVPVLRGSRLSIRVVFSRWLAGESIEAIAEDYGVHGTVIEQALREWAGRPRNWTGRVEIRTVTAAER